MTPTAAQQYSIAEVSRLQARDRPTATVFSFEGQQQNYLELDRASNRCANALLTAGIVRGDRIAFLGKNSPLYFELIIAAAKIGAIMTPLNWRLTEPELVYVLNDCAARLIFADAQFCTLVSQLASSLNARAETICVKGNSVNCQDYETWRSACDDIDPMLDEHAEDDLLQLYTSGTTGKPKGAVLSSHALLTNRGQTPDDTLANWQTYSPDESALLAMPCFHVGGSAFGLGIMHFGAHAVVVAEYDPATTLDLIEQYRIGKIFMVPAALQMLLADPRTAHSDFSSLKYVFYGASPIPLELMRQSMLRLGCGFVQMYGMTETAGTIVALPPEDHVPGGSPKMRSVGKPLWGVELKIIDESGKTLSSNCIGEVATRSAKNMKGYWNLPQATKETIDAQGWLRTGDAGYLDDDGYLYIHDRVKDMIISGGENVYPAEVENALYSHPAVADVAVIGVPDDKWGEAVKAFVVLHEGETPTPEELISYARSKIAAFKCPKSIAFISALPRNASGKILRRELRIC